MATKPKKPTKPKRPRLSQRQLDAIRLGPQVAAVKYGMAPDQWKKIVAEAHRRGFTVAGQLSGAPDILKPRLKSAIAAEAQKNVATAYAPIEAELNSNESRIKALDEKRKRDDAFYQQWLNDRHGELEASARTADQMLVDNAHAIAADAAKGWADAQAAAGQTPAAPAGTSPGVAASNPADSRSLQAIVPAAGAAAEHIANSRTQGNIGLAASLNDLAFGKQANLAQGAALESARMANTWQALSDNRADRTKIGLQRADDATKEIERLMGVEISKAQAQQQFDAVAEKLGLSRDIAQQKADQAKRDYKLKLKKYKTDLKEWRAAERHKQHEDMLADRKFKLDQKKYGTDKAKDNYQRRHKLGPYAPPSKGGKGKDGSKPTITDGQRKTSQNAYKGVETAKARIIQLHKRGWKPSKIRPQLLEDGYDNATIDIAEDLRKNHGKLSPAGVRKAKRIGVIHPEKVWGTV